ncbi:NAC domain-containing protein 89 [Linum perenne]
MTNSQLAFVENKNKGGANMAAAEKGGVSRETQMSIAASLMFPGFRFSPSDVELISYYLKKKMDGEEKCVEVIPEVEICKHEPWDLPAKSVVQSETEWFFFSSRGKKYPNGSQNKRATELGYWKATGKERSVRSGSAVIGTKRTLVFHIGRAPKGERTEWIMHEFCMQSGPQQDSLVVCRLRRNVDFRGHHDTTNCASEGNRVVEANAAENSKKTNSSSDSSIEQQIDSVSNNGSESYKLSNAATPAAAETSSRHNHDLQLLDDSYQELRFTDAEEDFFSDILNDDIIKLDDALLVTSLPQAAAEADKLPFSTANRRAKLDNRRRRKIDQVVDAVGEDEEAEKKRQCRSKKVPSCIVGLVMFVRNTRGNQVAVLFVVVVLAVVGLLALVGSLYGEVPGTENVRTVLHLPESWFRFPGTENVRKVLHLPESWFRFAR